MKATRPSATTQHTKYWRRPDEVIDVIDLRREARAANLPALMAKAAKRKSLFEKD